MKGRAVYKRVECLDSELEDVCNQLLADGWGLAEAPIAQDQRVVGFLREKVEEEDISETLTKRAAEGWDDLTYEMESGDEWKGATLLGQKYEEQRHKVVAVRFLGLKEEVRGLRLIVAQQEDELEALRVEAVNEGETGEE